MTSEMARIVHSLKNVDLEVDDTFCYMHSTYFRDTPMQSFFERLFGVTLRAAYSSPGTPVVDASDTRLEVKIGHIVLYKTDGEHIQFHMSDCCIIRVD